MVKLNGKLVLVGAGKMGGAMLAGWLKAGVPPQQIAVLDPSPPPEIAAILANSSVSLNPVLDSIVDAEVLVIAVKPQVMDDVLQRIVALGKAKPLILSIAAGKPIALYTSYFGEDAAVIRAMPNTPAAIGRGITAMASSQHVTSAQMGLAQSLLAATGEVVSVDNETLIDAVTAVSGSGPAYVFLLVECMAAAGEKLGLAPALAARLAQATVAGAGELMRQSSEDPAQLRKNVTSPNGTTFAALQVLMAENGLGQLMDRAIAAAEQRAKEMSM